MDATNLKNAYETYMEVGFPSVGDNLELQDLHDELVGFDTECSGLVQTLVSEQKTSHVMAQHFKDSFSKIQSRLDRIDPSDFSETDKRIYTEFRVYLDLWSDMLCLIDLPEESP